MNSQIPNPAQPAAPTPAVPAAKRPGGWAAALTIIVGSAALVALLVAGIWTGAERSAAEAFDETVEAAAAEQVTIQLDVGQLEVVFGGGDTATLESAGRWPGGSPLTMVHDGSALVIETQRNRSWFGIGNTDLRATLHLPSRLEGVVEIDAEVDVGELIVRGDVARLHAELDVGDLTLEGSVAAATLQVGLGRATLEGGGGAIEASTDAGELRLFGDFDELRTRAELGTIVLDGTVRTMLAVEVAVGDATVALHDALPARAELHADLGSISVAMPDEPFQLAAAASIRDAAEAEGFDIDGGAAAPEFIASASVGDVSFDIR